MIFGSPLIYAAGGAFLVASVWGHGYVTGSDGKGEAIKSAVASRDQQWEIKISEKNDEIKAASAKAKAAAETVAPTSDDSAERLRQCRQSPTCRDGRK